MNTPKNKLHRKNEDIKVPFVVLITDTGEKKDKIPTREALEMAYDRGMDLVLVADTTTPPIAKIMDWGKYKYEQTKKEQQNRKAQKIAEIKEIRLRPKTGTHDLEVKMGKIKEFLAKGHKVKISMVFRGREAMYLDKGKENLKKLIADIANIAQPESYPSYQFKRLSVTLIPIKKN
ncbi:translation initiation factor IF-3 [Candidatus Microgenomates bacterium]|nr:translation initiation factor IF-3 [Candidatus Microgenomates bacterium]